MKRILTQTCAIITILFFATACDNGEKNNDLNGKNKVTLIVNEQAFTAVENNRTSGKGNTVSNPFEIKGVERTGDILKVEVSYSGGCEQHTFDVLWGGQILLTEPCQINLILTHDANGDACEAYLSKTLEIDLLNLVGDNDSKDSCVYNVFSALNESDTPDGVVTLDL